MKIEVLLTDKVNENIDNYDENRNLLEANQFEAKKNQMLYFLTRFFTIYSIRQRLVEGAIGV